MPGQVHGQIAAGNPDAVQVRFQRRQVAPGAVERCGVADDPRVLPHDPGKPVADSFQVPGWLRQRLPAFPHGGFDGGPVRIPKPAAVRHPPGDGVAGDGAEDGGIGDPVAAQAIGAVDAAGILAGGEKPVSFRPAVGGELDAPHHVVRRRHHLDPPGHQIEPAIGAAFDHARELAANLVPVQVAHG